MKLNILYTNTLILNKLPTLHLRSALLKTCTVYIYNSTIPPPPLSLREVKDQHEQTKSTIEPAALEANEPGDAPITTMHVQLSLGKQLISLSSGGVGGGNTANKDFTVGGFGRVKGKNMQFKSDLVNKLCGT